MKGIKVGDKISKYPIIQGGMGVGISMHNLAGSVSKEGGIGIISTADIGYLDEDFNKNQLKANKRAIEQEIKLAREIAGEDKIIGVNVMVALKDYEEIVKKCVEERIDLIISGAGLPKELPEYVKNSNTKIAPIVSSLRCCKFIVNHWIKKYDYVPDMIVIEGPEAGGHLGFKKDELIDENKPSLEMITKEVVDYIHDVEMNTNKTIPVIVAGGIWDSKDIKKYLKLGASGVQMATRFVATEECDADIEYKKAYIKATSKDVKIINSPVGMPGRAINNKFIQNVEKQKEKISRCYNCIKTCNIKETPYCITRALINAAKGKIDEALIFCGSNVDRVKEIVKVHDLMQDLVKGLT